MRNIVKSVKRRRKITLKKRKRAVITRLRENLNILTTASLRRMGRMTTIVRDIKILRTKAEAKNMKMLSMRTRA